MGRKARDSRGPFELLPMADRMGVLISHLRFEICNSPVSTVVKIIEGR